MQSNFRATPNVSILLARSKPDLVAKTLLPPKYTLEDWVLNNNHKFNLIRDQEVLVERINEESMRTIDEVSEITKDGQREVEHKTRERIAEIHFLTEELGKKKKAAMLEIEALGTYLNRLKVASEFLRGKSLAICQQCLQWRDSRIGVELCVDEVDQQLRAEIKILKGCQQMLDKVQRETAEQLRKLRAAMVFLDLDLEQKHAAERIDERNNKLKHRQSSLGQGVDLSLWRCHYSLADWSHQTYLNLENITKDLTSASNMRPYIDMLLNQVCEDMRNQTERTNQAFERRINSVKSVKSAMEDKHRQTSISITNVEHTIKILEDEISDKDRAMLLCKTRLSNRAHRPGIESTCDFAHEALFKELNALQVSMCKLKQKLAENKALLRYLMHVQIMQEEEINLKANDIKIDECDCMILREMLIYTHF